MNSPAERDTELRRMLVARAEADGIPRAPRRLGLAAAGAALLVTGGIVGGGVVAAAAATGPDPAEVAAGVAIVRDVARPGTILLGDLVHVTVTDSHVVSLGPPPDGANGLAIATRCVEAGHYELWFDGAFGEGGECDGPGHGAGGGVQSLESGAPREITIASGSVELWAMWVTTPPFPTPSALQREALADGVVTRDEYLAGYDRFAGCMGALGYPLEFVDRSSDVIDYAYRAEAADQGVDELCYATEFDGVDSSWQVYRGAPGVDPGVYP
jgi:hypothetical protein